MKFSSIIFLSGILLITACNSKRGTEVASAQTADSIAAVKKAEHATKPVVEKMQTTSQDHSTTTSSETMTSESVNAAETKTGWSKTAKGAVIGAAVGAGTGAIVNKKNRAVGAVIGGAAGAGAGAVIGNEMDKKDGRH